MVKTKNWFEISTSGLKELQSGKSKSYIVRELIANAFDENITKCEVELFYNQDNEEAVIRVIDNNPEGFKDLRDAYTLFRTTHKRKNIKQRGRFNIGEKQAISICEIAKIATTKGTIIFDKNGRTETKDIFYHGSSIELVVKMTLSEYKEILDILDKYLSPKNIKFIVNEKTQVYKKPFHITEASLETELLQNGIIRKVWRKTKIHILKNFHSDNKTYLYEMGIPVCEINCNYNIDIQQKIPLSIDRETVPEKYLNEVYTEVLNAIYKDIQPEDSSATWIRIAVANRRIDKKALKTITELRFGDKICIANPFDRDSIDEAISRGYKVIYGSELSKKEWSNLRENKILNSSSDLFGKIAVGATYVEPDEKQKLVAKLAQKIAMKLLAINLKVQFVKSKADCAAYFGNNSITFNLTRLPKDFFKDTVSERTLDLILHELGHSAGYHTEKSYHELITKMGSQLIILALKEPNFFEIQKGV